MKDKSDLDNSPREKGEGLETVSGADDRRRRLVKGSLLAAPVLASLQSRPVLAGACLSNVLSGNLSNANNGNCQLGWSPEAWGNPGGNIGVSDEYTTLQAWDKALGAAGCPTNVTQTYGCSSYGTFDGSLSGCSNGQPMKQCSCYTGGATLNDVLLYPSVYPSGIDGTTPLREILCSTSTSGTELWHCVAAMLNALLSQNDPNFNYVLNVADVRYYCANPLEAPGGDLNTFLNSTWA